MLDKVRVVVLNAQEYQELKRELEEKDIQKDLQKMIEQLENGLYSKETAEYSEETRELIISSLEQAVKIARMEAKNKFTPNKYKKG